MALKLSFAQEKGGVGKTTLNIITANYLFNRYPNKKVGFLDCDHNKSATGIRNFDEQKGLKDGDSYDFAYIPPNELPKHIDVLDNEYDYIIIDLPGNIAQHGVLSVYILLDFVFVPLLLSKTDLNTSFKYVNMISEQLPALRAESGLKPPRIYGVHNQIHLIGSEDKQWVYDGISPYTELHIPLMKSYMPRTKYLTTELSTIGLFEKCSKNIEIMNFFEEVLHILSK